MVNPIALKIRSKKLGVLIRDARLAAGKSMKECAEAIGVTPGRFSSFERGTKTPSLPELETLAYVLKVPLQHFWGREVHSDDLDEQVEAVDWPKAIALRQRIVGVLLRRARTEQNVSMKELAQVVGISTRRLKSYEMGEEPIPLPELELMASHLNLPLDHFRDTDGVVGRWIVQQQAVQKFMELPADLQEFVVQPVNRPYLEMAYRLSELPVEKLRAMAEGLLEITL